MLRQFPLEGFPMLAITAMLFAFLVVYLWVATNALVALIALLAGIGVIWAVSRMRRPPAVQ
jgi:Flp pilus assembly protein TadB